MQVLSLFNLANFPPIFNGDGTLLVGAVISYYNTINNLFNVFCHTLF